MAEITALLISAISILTAAIAGVGIPEPTLTGQFSNNTSFNGTVSSNITENRTKSTDVQNRTIQRNASQKELNGTSSNISTKNKAYNQTRPANTSRDSTNQTQLKQNNSSIDNSTGQDKPENTSEKRAEISTRRTSSSNTYGMNISKGEAGILTVETEANNPKWKVDGELRSSDQNADLLLENGSHTVTLESQNTSVSRNISVDTDGMALIQNEFYIFKYEASRSDATNDSEGTSNVPASQKAVEPWKNISQKEAERACSRLGERYSLPSAEQWYKTVNSGQKGNAIVNISGNTDGAKSHRYPEQTCTESPVSAWNEEYCLTGTGPEEWKTPSGVHDMKGNLWEWIGKTVNVTKKEKFSGLSGWIKHHEPGEKPELMPKPPSKTNKGYYYSAERGLYAVRKGGAWFSQQRSGVLSTNIDRKPEDERTSIGFRCAFNP